MEESEKETGNPYVDAFTYWHAVFIVGAIITYLADLTLGEHVIKIGTIVLR